ncbi:MAG: hypothetical protein RR602_00280 [Longicatena sp.]
MEVIIYLIVICLVVYLVITLLPIILPLILILILIVTVFIWYAKRKFIKHMNEFENNNDEFNDEMNYQQSQDTYHSSSNNRDDIIDVEFSEREDEES